jgi:hypothetical protein
MADPEDDIPTLAFSAVPSTVLGAPRLAMAYGATRKGCPDSTPRLWPNLPALPMHRLKYVGQRWRKYHELVGDASPFNYGFGSVAWGSRSRRGDSNS